MSEFTLGAEFHKMFVDKVPSVTSNKFNIFLWYFQYFYKPEDNFSLFPIVDLYLCTDLNSTYFIQVELIIATLLFTCLLFPFPFWYYFNPLMGKSIKLAMTFMHIVGIVGLN